MEVCTALHGLENVGGRQSSRQNKEISGIIIPTVHGTSFCALGVIELYLSEYDEWIALQKEF